MGNRTLLIEARYESREAVIQWLCHAIPQLPEYLRPTHYGLGETVVCTQTNAISDDARFQEFLRTHDYNCALHSAGGWFDVAVHSGATTSSTVTYWGSASNPECTEAAERCLISLARHAIYGFACEWEEYRARHGYVLQYVDGGKEEGWCGRDHRRYVPGLFWLNYFSRSYVEQMNIQVPDILSCAGSATRVVDGGTIVRMYEHPRQWTEHRKNIEAIIDGSDYMFSMRDVHVPTGLSWKEGLSERPNWHAQWP